MKKNQRKEQTFSRKSEDLESPTDFFVLAEVEDLECSSCSRTSPDVFFGWEGCLCSSDLSRRRLALFRFLLRPLSSMANTTPVLLLLLLPPKGSKRIPRTFWMGLGLCGLRFSTGHIWAVKAQFNFIWARLVDFGYWSPLKGHSYSRAEWASSQKTKIVAYDSIFYYFLISFFFF